MGASVRYAGAPIRVRFLDRPNRFLARVQWPGAPVTEVHVPNPGRMRELLRPGRTWGWVVPARPGNRRTTFDLVAVRHRGTLVSVDSQVGNRLVRASIRMRRNGAGWRAEVPYAGHRFDFGRVDQAGELRALLEVKSSNWRIGGTALFPDAPSRRGAEHLGALREAADRGLDATVLFVVQREDVRSFAIHRRRDPALGAAFDVARGAGVRVRARCLRVHPDAVGWGRALPVRSLGPPGTY